MKAVAVLALLLLSASAIGQSRKLDDLGFTHVKLLYKKDQVDVLIKAKAGDEAKKKPLFFFCQGSLPIPLIILDGEQAYPVFPFDTQAICEKYHLVIVGKPGIPLIRKTEELQPDFSYFERDSPLPPSQYLSNNTLEYYVGRNLQVLNHLIQMGMGEKSRLVVSGHSQGARVALEMALRSKKVTHLVYANGNPCGQIMSMISTSRQQESGVDTTESTESVFRYYEAVVADRNNPDVTYGDSYRSLFSFSGSTIKSFPRLDIPVLICYGTRDPSLPFNDYLRAEMIRNKKQNFTFQSYPGLEHNFFGLRDNGEIDFEAFNWDRVAKDWIHWLNNK